MWLGWSGLERGEGKLRSGLVLLEIPVGISVERPGITPRSEDFSTIFISRETRASVVHAKVFLLEGGRSEIYLVIRSRRGGCCCRLRRNLERGLGDKLGDVARKALLQRMFPNSVEDG